MKILLIATVVLVSIFAENLDAGEIDLTFCLDPLVLRNSFEAFYECGQTQVPYNSLQELQAMLGDPDPIEFCVGAFSGTGYSACTDTCNVELQNGCYGTLKANELVLNPTNSKICGNYSMQVPDIDVHSFGQSCSLSMTGTGGMVNQLDSTYSSPLTWQINASNAQLSNVEFSFSGCGDFGSILDFVIGSFSGLFENLVQDLINGIFDQPGGLRICPVDSLHPEFIPAPP